MDQPAASAPADAGLSGDEYGTDIEYDVELETLVQAVESQVGSSVAAAPAVDAAPVAPPDQLMDIEDVAVTLASPFERFRKKGWLSVSDLVGTVWCEVQVRADLVSLSICLLRVADERNSMTSQLILMGLLLPLTIQPPQDHAIPPPFATAQRDQKRERQGYCGGQGQG
jgi:hypothetical protein